MANEKCDMGNAFLSINSESIPQQQGQQVVDHCRIDRQVAVLFASEDCVGGWMLHQSCDSGFRRIDVEGESEEALARNAAVAGDEHFLEGFLARLTGNAAWRKERSRLAFDIDYQRPGQRRRAIAAEKM